MNTRVWTLGGGTVSGSRGFCICYEIFINTTSSRCSFIQHLQFSAGATVLVRIDFSHQQQPSDEKSENHNFFKEKLFGNDFRWPTSDLVPEIIHWPLQVKRTSLTSNFKWCRNFFGSLFRPYQMLFGVHFRWPTSDIVPKIIHGPLQVKLTFWTSNFKQCRNFFGSLLGPHPMLFGVHFRWPTSDLVPKIIHGPLQVNLTSWTSNFKQCRNFFGSLLGPHPMLFGVYFRWPTSDLVPKIIHGPQIDLLDLKLQTVQ